MSEIIQGSDEWFAARLGRATCSKYKDVLAKGEGKTRTKYLKQLVAERLTGEVEEGFSNGHTDRGTEQEPFARMSYEAITGNLVEEVGFIQHATLMTGGSPDGLIGIDGGCEIKSVLSTVQIDTIEAGGYPSSHKAQIQGLLWITGRSWFDFCSFSPKMPENLRTYIFRVQRDELYIATLASEVITFLDGVDSLVAKLKGMKNGY